MLSGAHVSAVLGCNGFDLLLQQRVDHAAIVVHGGALQAQKRSQPTPASQFSVHEADGAEDLLELMKRLALSGDGGAQANGNIGEPHELAPAAGARMCPWLATASSRVLTTACLPPAQLFMGAHHGALLALLDYTWQYGRVSAPSLCRLVPVVTAA